MVQANNFTAVNLKGIIETANNIIEGLKVADNYTAQQYVVKRYQEACDDFDEWEKLLWSLIRLQLFEEQLISEDPENISPNQVVNGNLNYSRI